MSSAMRPANMRAGVGVPSGVGSSLRRYGGLGTTLEPLATGWESSLGGEPGEEHGVFDAGLASDMHHWQLAGAQEPGKGVRAHAQPPLGFFEGDQLWGRGELQGEVLLPRGRARSGA
jgi:hypothetical protein